jgi:hypothetical protein
VARHDEVIAGSHRLHFCDASGQLLLFASTGSGDPHAGSQVRDFTNGTMADLLVTRDASGLFSAFVEWASRFQRYGHEWGHNIFRLIEYDVSGTIWGGSRCGGPEGAYWFNGRPWARLLYAR